MNNIRGSSHTMNNGIIGGSSCLPWSWLIDAVPWEHLCFGRGLLFFKNRRLKTTHSGVPDDIVTDILNRLPATSLIRFRYVCKQWYELISTNKSVLDMLYASKPPTQKRNTYLAVQYIDRDGVGPMNQLDLFFISSDAAVGRDIRLSLSTRYLFRSYEISLISSYRGFLLFTAKAAASSSPEEEEEEDSALILYNPVTTEQVTVTAPPSRYVYCGFFYHSPTGEYRVLYQVFNDECMAVGFEILGLRTRLLRKINSRNNFSPKYFPDTSTPAVISNGALHWMVSETQHKKDFGGLVPSCSETILSFGMVSEEFRLMPHPGHAEVCAKYRTPGHKMSLLDKEGKLCVCDAFRGTFLYLWVLVDYKKWVWGFRQHPVSLHQFWKCWPHVNATYGKEFKALQIHQGELLLEWHPDPFHIEYLLYDLKRVPNVYKFAKKDLEHALKHVIHHKKKCFEVVIDRLHLPESPFIPSSWHAYDGFMRRIVIKHVKSAEQGRMVGLTCSLFSLHSTDSIFSLHDNQLHIIE